MESISNNTEVSRQQFKVLKEQTEKYRPHFLNLFLVDIHFMYNMAKYAPVKRGLTNSF